MSYQRPFRLAFAALLSTGAAFADFTDVTDSVGIDNYERETGHQFVVRGGTPIVMDFDNNGDLDLYIIRYELDDILYLNDNGSFTKTLNPLGLDTANKGNVGAWADIDNDGDKDMIIGVSGAKSHLLYLNNGDGSFTESAIARGLDHTAPVKNHNATAVTVGDLNRDGYLDVIIGSWGVNYDDPSDATQHGVFFNQGEANPGRFTNNTLDAGYLFPGFGIGIFAPAITDLDQDGWPDIATTADYGTGRLHWNNANGTFNDATEASGVGKALNAMGTAIGDIDNDGDLDWFVTTIAFSEDPTRDDNPLYINQGSRLFENKSVEAGVAYGGWGWGANMFDYDLDGDLDIVMVNESDFDSDNIENVGRMYLWRNDGDLNFTPVSNTENANELSKAAGLVTFDYNNDGALDIFYINEHDRPTLLQNNDVQSDSWLRVKLKATVSNPEGIGTFLTLQPDEDGPTYVREYNPTNAYLAQLSPYLHFGFPDHDGDLHKLTIKWPSGTIQELSNVSTDQLLTITEIDPNSEGDTIPVFASRPQNFVATRGHPLTLSVSFEGGFSPRVTWFRNGVLLAGQEGLEIAINNMQPRNAGTYHAVATNIAGSIESTPFIIGVRSDFSDRNIARQLNELVLDSARINFPDPPIVARNFFHCSSALWDAFWPYQPNGWGSAQALFHREELTSADWHGDREASQAEAMAHAVFTVAAERYRAAFNNEAILLALRDFMSDHGYDPDDTSAEGNTPSAVGNRIGQSILSLNFNDGSNEANGYADTSGYAPVNDPLIYGESGVTLNDPNRWQPLNLTQSITKNGIDLGPEIQQFLAPGWNWVTPFALEKPTDSTILIDPGPQPLFGADTHDQLIAELVEVIRASSIMDPAQDIQIDVSPGAPGQNNPYLTQDGEGHPLNPFTGQPYAPHIVNQGDYYRLTAEFWSDGPGIEGPPGVWNMMHNEVSDEPLFERKLGGVGPELSALEWDVHAYVAMNGALHDAAIAAWAIKSRYDSIRPISIIRYLAALGQSSDSNQPYYHAQGLPLEEGLIELITAASTEDGQPHAHLKNYIGELAVYSWKGVPAKPSEDISGVGWVRAADWSPYHLRTFPTPNFAGYISGHSTFSRAGAEVMTLLTGSPFFPGGIREFDFDKGEYLQVEYGPSEDLTIPVATYYDAADLTGVARIYCGVHIAADDFVGRKVGARVGADAVLKTLSLRSGAVIPQGLANMRIQTQLAPDTGPALLEYKSETPLPMQRSSSIEEANQNGLEAIHIIPAANGEVSFLAQGQSLQKIILRGNLSSSHSITLEFEIKDNEPSLLLASALGHPNTNLALYEKIDSNFQPHSNNQNWIEHPQASIASIFTNRRELAGAELSDTDAALPLTLPAGNYKLELTTPSQTPTPCRLIIEQVQ